MICLLAALSQRSFILNKGMADPDNIALIKVLENTLKELPNIDAKSVMAELARLLEHTADIPETKTLHKASQEDDANGISAKMQKQVQEVISAELEQWMKKRLPKVMQDTIEAINNDDNDNPS